MKGVNHSLLSLLASSICLVGMLILNYNLAQLYLAADGKTKALFGLVALGQSRYKFYFIPMILFSLIFVGIAIQKRETRRMLMLSSLACLLVMASFFVPLWQFMI